MSPLRRWGAPTLSMAQLQVKQHPTPKHTELVTGAGWSSSNERERVAKLEVITTALTPETRRRGTPRTPPREEGTAFYLA